MKGRGGGDEGRRGAGNDFEEERNAEEERGRRGMRRR